MQDPWYDHIYVGNRNMVKPLKKDFKNLLFFYNRDKKIVIAVHENKGIVYM